jgi:hypothetical protein
MSVERRAAAGGRPARVAAPAAALQRAAPLTAGPCRTCRPPGRTAPR